MTRQNKYLTEKDSRFVYWWCSLYVAFFLVLMAVAQLFAFEEMPEVIASWGLVTSGSALLVAAVLVVLEVAAIPALLGMKLVPKVRLVSSIAGWTVLLIWLGVALWLAVTAMPGVNSGMFGSMVHLPPGWWMVSFVALLLTMRVVASYNARHAR